MIRIVDTDKEWWFSRLRVPPGRYFLGDVPLAQALTQNAVKAIEEAQEPPVNHREFKPGETVVLARPGSFGDLLLLTSLVTQIRIDHPETEVKVACHPRYAPILHGVVDTVEYPILYSDRHEHFDHVAWLEGVVEHPDESDKFSRYTTLYAKAVGYDTIDNDFLEYILTPEEAAYAEDNFPKEDGKVRVGVQVKASALNRTYNQQKLIEVMAHLLNRGVADEIFLIGAPGEITFPEVDKLVNLSAMDMSVRMSIAAASTCDALLVPDSLMMHVAGALDIPCLVLAGAFDPSQTQAAKVRSTQVIRGFGACRNCRHIPVAGNQFPPEQKCSVEGHCIVIDGISPDLIAHGLKKVLQGKTL